MGGALFTVFGLGTELVFTGVSAGWSGSFRGHVSLLMIPVYVFAFFLAPPLLAALERRGWQRPAIRLPATVLLIYAIEWGWGAGYGAIGLTPWHYDHGWASDFSGGRITLYYAPAWLVFAFLVVPVIRTIQRLAPLLVKSLGGANASR